MINATEVHNGAHNVENEGSQTNRKNKYLPVRQRNGRKISHLEQRNRKYYARFQVENHLTGVKKTRRFPLKAANVTEAKEELTLIKAELAQGKLTISRKGPLLRDAIESYIDILRNTGAKRPRTISAEATGLVPWKRMFGNKRVEQIKPSDVRKFMESRLQEGCKPGTVNLGVIYLNNVLTPYLDDQQIVELPTSKIKPLKCDKVDRWCPSSEEIDRLCRSAMEILNHGEVFADFIRLLRQ
ncbi:MAG TPA: hypothetical protein EYQ50_10165 [Verrucomicrobiales bacterium]|nr:hypothetical protein [Verrucomicrobiales bacterium]